MQVDHLSLLKTLWKSLGRASALEFSNYLPPTHNREPYDTRLSDTMVTHPSASS